MRAAQAPCRAFSEAIPMRLSAPPMARPLLVPSKASVRYSKKRKALERPRRSPEVFVAPQEAAPKGGFFVRDGKLVDLKRAAGANVSLQPTVHEQAAPSIRESSPQILQTCPAAWGILRALKEAYRWGKRQVSELERFTPITSLGRTPWHSATGLCRLNDFLW